MSINIEPALMFDPVLGLGHEVIGLTAESLIEHHGQFKIKTKRANGISSACKSKVEGEVMGSLRIRCVGNLPIK
jgi:hypothetical protein